MNCQYGDQYHNPRTILSKRVRLQGTRKMGCKVKSQCQRKKCLRYTILLIWEYVVFINFILYRINQPNSNYAKPPGATFCDELPLDKPSSRSIQTFTEASEFLKGYDRQIHPILGNGNCLFRAVSYLLCGQEDHHQQISWFYHHKLWHCFEVLYTQKFQRTYLPYEVWDSLVHRSWTSCGCILSSTPNLCVHTEK